MKLNNYLPLESHREGARVILLIVSLIIFFSLVTWFYPTILFTTLGSGFILLILWMAFAPLRKNENSYKEDEDVI